MKKLIAILFLVCGTLTSHAQKEPTNQIQADEEVYLYKGLWMIGGNGRIYVEKIGTQTGRLIAIIEPQTGYFFTRYLAAGLRLPMSFKSTEYEVATTPFIRFYAPIQGNIIPFAELNGGYSIRAVKDVNGDESKTNSYLYGVRTGAAFFIKKNISLDLFLYYSGKKSSTKYPDGSTSEPITNQFMGVGAGFQIYL